MTAYKQRPIDDGGLIVAGFSKANEINNLNVLTGKIKKTIPTSGKTEDFKIKSPLLFHFGGENMNSPLYIAQKTLLTLNRTGIPTLMATAFVNLTISWPHQFYLFIKLTTKKIVRRS